jgi:integrase
MPKLFWTRFKVCWRPAAAPPRARKKGWHFSRGATNAERRGESMGVYKRGRIWWFTYIGLDGRQKFESSGSVLKSDAEYKLACRRKDLGEGREPIVKKIPNYSFSHLADEYLKWAERQRSFRSKKGFVDQLRKDFGDAPLRRFSSMLIEQYQSERIKHGRKVTKVKRDDGIEEVREGNKPATINRLVATLKHMFTKAVEWDMVEEETLKRIRKVKLLEENNRRLRFLTREEGQALLKACSEELRPIVAMALNTGMRKGEILSLTWDQVDLKHGFILLDRTKNGERREIPINETLRASLLQGLVRRLDVPFVFYDPLTGKPYCDIKKGFLRALRRSKIQDFKFHDLRHTFASHLVMAGVDLTTVKELLGHKSLVMTLRYAHLAPAHKVRAVQVLDEEVTSTASFVNEG